jgi:hypothetical protein
MEKPLNGVVTIYAEHISYQLNHIPVMPFTATSCQEALLRMVANSAQENPFSVWTDKTTTGNFKLDHPEEFRALLGGMQGSILDVYGKGEYEFDNRIVKLHVNRGADTGVVLRYGKNITDLTQDENIETTITGVCPYYKGEDGTVVTLPEKAVWAATAANFPYKRTAVIDFSEDWEEAPTVAQLRARANKYITDNDIGIPRVSLDVEFVPLWQMEGVSVGTPTRTLVLPASVSGETLTASGSVSGNTVTLTGATWELTYDDYRVLERVNLCDTLTVRYDALGVDATAKIVRTEYNVLKERYNALEIGDTRTNLAAQITNIDEEIANANRNMKNEVGALQAYVDKQTDLITGGLGGYVVMSLNAAGQPEEILIMDTNDMTTAVNVIRMNKNGIGFSTNGYSGPFRSAWTIDGTFNADFIGAGTITANLIKGGVLSDLVGKNTWDLQSGLISFANLAWNATNSSLTADGVLTCTNANISGNITMALSKSGVAYSGTLGSVTFNYYHLVDQAVKSYTTVGLNVSSDSGTSYNVLSAEGLATSKATAVNSSDDSPFFGTATRYHDFVTNGGTHYYHVAYLKDSFGYVISAGTTRQIVVELSGDAIKIGKSRGGIGIPSLRIDSSAQMINGQQVSFASSSSKRYKHGIQPLEDAHNLLKLEPKTFVYNEGHPLQYTDMEGQRLPGFIAEDVAEVYPSAVIHRDGEIESWDERRIIPGMLKLIQEQQERINDLEAHLKKLEDYIGGMVNGK